MLIEITAEDEVDAAERCGGICGNAADGPECIDDVVGDEGEVTLADERGLVNEHKSDVMGGLLKRAGVFFGTSTIFDGVNGEEI